MEETEEWLLWNLWMKQALPFLLGVKNKIPSSRMDQPRWLVTWPQPTTAVTAHCSSRILPPALCPSSRLSMLASPLPFWLTASNFLHLSSTSCFSLPLCPDIVCPPVLHSALPNFTCQTSSFSWEVLLSWEELPHRDLLILGRVHRAKTSVIFSTSSFPTELKMH